MQMTIKFEIDEAGRRGIWPKALSRAPVASRFWSRFHELSAGKYSGPFTESDLRSFYPGGRSSKETTASFAAWVSPSAPWSENERKLHQNFGPTLTAMLKWNLSPEVFPSLALEYEEKDIRRSAFDTLNIQITKIKYGSLEILAFAFGLAKLADLAGISTNDVMAYVSALAPLALNMSLDTQTPVTAEVSGGGDKADPVIAPSSSASQQASSLIQQSSPYFFPALLTLGVLGAGAWMTNGISSQLLEERKKLIDSLSAAEDRLGQQRSDLDKKFLDAYRAHEAELVTERSTLAAKISEFTTAMMETSRKMQDSAQQASNALASQQLGVIREMGNDARSREEKMFDLIKSAPAAVRPSPTTTQTRSAQRTGE
jgi:hypothetical protein